MKTTVTSGNQNGRLYRITYVAGEYDSHYELEVYNRETDQFLQQGGNFNSVSEAQSYLEQIYGANV